MLIFPLLQIGRVFYFDWKKKNRSRIEQPKYPSGKTNDLTRLIWKVSEEEQDNLGARETRHGYGNGCVAPYPLPRDSKRLKTTSRLFFQLTTRRGETEWEIKQVHMGAVCVPINRKEPRGKMRVAGGTQKDLVDPQNVRGGRPSTRSRESCSFPFFLLVVYIHYCERKCGRLKLLPSLRTRWL